MKFVIAPDSFKESMSASVAAMAIKKGFAKVYPDAQYALYPLADGGDGTLDALCHYINDAEIIETEVEGPLEKPVRAQLLYLPVQKTVFIEMAQASGLSLVEKSLRNPLLSSTYGVGQLALKALEVHPQRLLIGLGGSATNDGGAGFLQALGLVFKDINGFTVKRGGVHLREIETVEIGSVFTRFENIEITVLSDVVNPLLGNTGATNVYGPQKGATPEMLELLEQGMTHYAKVLEKAAGKSVCNLAGSGAAGGLGFAMRLLPNVRFQKGIDYILSLSDIEADVMGSEAVIIGEGSLDEQSFQGKVLTGIVSLAQKYRKKVIVFTGRIGLSEEVYKKNGVDYAFSINPVSEELSVLLKKGPNNLEAAAYHAAEMFRTKKHF